MRGGCGFDSRSAAARQGERALVGPPQLARRLLPQPETKACVGCRRQVILRMLCRKACGFDSRSWTQIHGGETGRRAVHNTPAALLPQCIDFNSCPGVVARPYFALLMPRSRVRTPPEAAQAVAVAQLVEQDQKAGRLLPRAGFGLKRCRSAALLRSVKSSGGAVFTLFNQVFKLPDAVVSCYSDLSRRPFRANTRGACCSGFSE